MVRTPPIPSSSGITPLPPERPPRRAKETETQKTTREKAIEKLGLQREQSGMLSRQKLPKMTKQTPSPTQLPGRIPRERTEAFLPKSPEEGSVRRRGSPPAGGVRVMPEGEALAPPPRPPRRHTVPSTNLPPLPSSSRLSSEIPPPSSSRLSSEMSSASSVEELPAAPSMPQHLEQWEEEEEFDVNALPGPSEPPPKVGLGELPHLSGLSQQFVRRGASNPSTSVDSAREVLRTPKAVDFLAKTQEGRRELLRRAERLLRSSFVDAEEAMSVMNTVIGAQTKAIMAQAGSSSSRSRSRKGSDVEPLTEDEMKTLQKNIQRFHVLEQRQPAASASRFKMQEHFENSGTNAAALSAQIARAHTLEEREDTLEIDFKEASDKISARRELHQRIVVATGGHPLIWINQHITDPQQKIAAIKFISDLQGHERVRIRDAQVLLDALHHSSAINLRTKNQLGKAIDRVKKPITRFEPGDVNLNKNLRTLRNVYNELIETERNFVAPLRAFLEPTYVLKDASGNKIKDENNHTIKLNYFQTLEHHKIISLEESQYYQNAIRQIIESSDRQFAQLQSIELDFSNLPQVMEILMAATSPAALYELTQGLSKIGERYMALLGHIRQEEARVDSLRPPSIEGEVRPAPKEEDTDALFRKAERKVAPGVRPRGISGIAITPVQRAPRYVMLFKELRKEMAKLGMEEAVQSLDERIGCLEACTRWANWKTPK